MSAIKLSVPSVENFERGIELIRTSEVADALETFFPISFCERVGHQAAMAAITDPGS